jgi:hypothetical protein
MLHENPLMVDADVDHWRNLQSLLLESAKGKRRIIVIHEDGRILKFVHSRNADIVKPMERIDEPHSAAKAIYEANPGTCDFVAVFERRGFDRYFGAFQDTWRADEDLDVYVHRSYAMMDEYPDAIVTYPGPARDTLGLQWRLGITYAAATDAVREYVVPESSVVFGVFDGTALWATLVLRFDRDHRVDVVTTVDPSDLMLAGGREAIAREIISWVEARYGHCSVGLFTDLEGARNLLAATDKAAALEELAARGALIANPMTTGPAPAFVGPG